MQAQSTVAGWLAAIFFTIAVAASFPLYGQGPAHPPAHWGTAPPAPVAWGITTGARFGAQLSAANPTIRCFGRRSFSCGAHFDARPILAGALIGGLLGALSTSAYYDAPFVPHTGSLQHTPNLPPANSSHAAWIADTWQQFGDPRSGSTEENSVLDSPFVEKWQQFFEPARQ